MNVRLPDGMVAAVSSVAEARGQDTNALLEALFSEAFKMLQVPGIVFADGPAGRRAQIAGTGIDVFEVVQAFIAEDRDHEQFAAAFHWLDARQLDAALKYHRLFPDDVSPFLANPDGTYSNSAE